MKRKSTVAILVIAAALLGAGLWAGLSRSETMIEARDDARALAKGILSPEQFKLMNNFRKSHGQEHLAAMRESDPVELWTDLGLTGAQQDKVLDLIDDNVDQGARLMGSVHEAGSGLRVAALAGDPDATGLEEDSEALGQAIGEAAIFGARMNRDFRALLTPDQIKVLDQHTSRRIAMHKLLLDEMPTRVEEAASLWDQLDLTPGQIDALSVVKRRMENFMHRRHRAGREEFREDLAGVLTPEQTAKVDGFRAAHHKDGREGHCAAREKFLEKLGLTGEQKKALAELAIANRDRIELMMDAVAKNAMDLEDKVLDPRAKETDIRAAGAKLGKSLGLASVLGAQLMKDAKKVLTPAQLALLHDTAEKKDKKAAQRLDKLPTRVHEFIALLDSLELTHEQKQAIEELIGEKREERLMEFEKMLSAE